MRTSTAMNALAASPGPSAVAFAVAAVRRGELLAETDHDRLLRQTRPAAPPVVARRLRVARAVAALIRR